MGFPKFYMKKIGDGTYTIYKSGVDFKRYDKSIVVSEIKQYKEAKTILDELLNGEFLTEEIYTLRNWISVNSNTVNLASLPSNKQINYFNSLYLQLEESALKNQKISSYLTLIKNGLPIKKISNKELSKAIDILLSIKQ